MNKSAKFWVFMAIFQVLFGWSVYAVTRHYTLQQASPSTAALPPAHDSFPAFPDTASGNELERLMDLYPAQPADMDPEKILLQADNHFAREEYEEAARGYAQLLDMGVRNVDIYNNLGITLHYLGRSVEALQVLEEGTEIDPAYQRIWLTMGFVNSQLGQFDQARTALEQARSLDADSEVGQAAQQMLNQLVP